MTCGGVDRQLDQVRKLLDQSVRSDSAVKSVAPQPAHHRRRSPEAQRQPEALASGVLHCHADMLRSLQTRVASLEQTRTAVDATTTQQQGRDAKDLVVVAHREHARADRLEHALAARSEQIDRETLARTEAEQLVRRAEVRCQQYAPPLKSRFQERLWPSTPQPANVSPVRPPCIWQA